MDCVLPNTGAGTAPMVLAIAGAAVTLAGMATWVLVRRRARSGLGVSSALIVAGLIVGGSMFATAPHAEAASADCDHSSATPTPTQTQAQTQTPESIPDLTPEWSTPNLEPFTSTSQVKTVVLKLDELLGAQTTSGTITFRVTKASGFPWQAYDPTLTTATPTGGAAQAVSNGSFTVTENSGFLIFTAVPGFSLPADGSVAIALNIGVTPVAPPNTQQNITATIVGDPTSGYDSSSANNLSVLHVSLAPAPS